MIYHKHHLKNHNSRFASNDIMQQKLLIMPVSILSTALFEAILAVGLTVQPLTAVRVCSSKICDFVTPVFK